MACRRYTDRYFQWIAESNLATDKRSGNAAKKNHLVERARSATWHVEQHQVGMLTLGGDESVSAASLESLSLLAREAPLGWRPSATLRSRCIFIPEAAMRLVPASSSSLFAFWLIVVGVVAAYALGTHVAAQREQGPDVARSATLRFLLGLALWLGGFCLFVGAGAVERRPFPLVPVTFLTLNLVAAGFAFSASGRRLALHLPLGALVGFQAFRLPLELVLHAWAERGTIPTTMTWTGANFDVVSGVMALVLAPFATRRAVAWVVNVVGLTLLVNVGRVAVLSSPLPFAWDVQPKLALIAHLPYALIGPVCVGGALAGHIILTRRLLAWRAASR